jgi:uncharacterized protein YuzE
MKITYDSENDAMYIYFSKKEIAETVEGPDSLHMELGSEGTLVGIEVLGGFPSSKGPTGIDSERS